MKILDNVYYASGIFWHQCTKRKRGRISKKGRCRHCNTQIAPTKNLEMLKKMKEFKGLSGPDTFANLGDLLLRNYTDKIIEDNSIYGKLSKGTKFIPSGDGAYFYKKDEE